MGWFFEICQIWVGFVKYGLSRGLSNMGSRICHIWGSRGVDKTLYYLDPPCPVPSFIWSLSLRMGFVTYGLVLWDLSNMGWICQIQVGVCHILAAGFVTYGVHRG